MAYNANIQYVHQLGSNEIAYGAPFARPDQLPQTQSSSSTNRRYGRVILWIGYGEITLGTIQCLLCIVSLIVADRIQSEGVTQVSPGIWCGMFLITCGIFGVLGDKYKTAAFYGINIAMCIFTAIFMGILITLSAIFAIVEAQESDTLKGLHISLAALGGLGFGLAVVHSAFTCAGCCCTSPSTPTAQPVPIAYTTQFVHPVNLPASYPANQRISGHIPPNAHCLTSMPANLTKQEFDGRMPPPPYSP